MAPDRLAEIRKRCGAATPGPMRAIGGSIFCDVLDSERGQGTFILYDRAGYSGPDCNREGDSQFFAHARHDVPDLLAEVERLRSLWREAGQICNATPTEISITILRLAGAALDG